MHAAAYYNTNNTANMLPGISLPQRPDVVADFRPPTTTYGYEGISRYAPLLRANSQKQRSRSASPRRDRRDRSRSRSREQQRSRRDRSPTNGYYDSGSYRDRPAPNKEQIMSNVRENSQQERRVYVGNLSYDVKWHHLKDFMRQGQPLQSHPDKYAKRSADHLHSR